MARSLYASLVLASVRRASRCSAGIQHLRLNRGLAALKAISQTAPFVGLIGTCLGIMNIFRSIGTSRSTGLNYILGYLGEALVPGCLGIAVALFAVTIFRCLMTKMEIFDLEMENVSAGLLNILTLHVAKLSTFQQKQ